MRSMSFLPASLVVVAAGWFALAAPVRAPAQGTPPSDDQSPATRQADAGTPSAARPGISPRFELSIPSLDKLVTAARESNAGELLAPLGRMLFEAGRASSEGVDVEGVAALLKQMEEWPDVAVEMATYAPDTEGRARWAVRVNWPPEDLRARVERLLQSDAGAELLAGLKLVARPAGGFELALPEATLGYLLPGADSGSLLVSHDDVAVPADVYRGPPVAEDGEPVLLACRLNLKGTEKDSGALWQGSFSAVTAVEYSVRMSASGDWLEAIGVRWPPISGLGAKVVFDRVKQTFFVPRAAFGAAVFSSMMVPGTLDNLVGFGPQVVMDAPGEVTVVGEAQPGPLARHVDGQACLTLLPGTGFLPVPDIVLQAKAKDVAELVADVRAAAEASNRLLRERELPEPWHETTVRDRTVFWSDGANRYPGALLPVVMRPVIFATRERDARQRQRDFVVIAWTSTDPADFVRRWLDLPRGQDRLFLPQKRRTDGQVWLNWKQLYRWVAPYFNLGLSAVVRDALLPRAEEIGPRMTDGLATAKMGYSGLKLSYRGPLPSGAVVVPAMLAASLAEAEAGSSDLARERLACRRLRMLYHHSKLFKKDMGRWPAEIAELRGYIDFEGHPELLKLKLSPKKRLGEWFRGIFASSSDQRDDDEEDAGDGAGLDDELYVINWGRDSWTLGFAPGTFEHLEELYIDQDGKIHRKPAEAKPAADSQPSTDE